MGGFLERSREEFDINKWLSLRHIAGGLGFQMKYRKRRPETSGYFYHLGIFPKPKVGEIRMLLRDVTHMKSNIYRCRKLVKVAGICAHSCGV